MLKTLWKSGTPLPDPMLNCPGRRIAVFGYEPASGHENQWVCRLDKIDGKEYFAGLKAEGVIVLTREEWHALVTRLNKGNEPTFMSYLDL